MDLSGVGRFTTTPINLIFNNLDIDANAPDGSVFLMGENNADASLRVLTGVDANGAVKWESRIIKAANNQAFFSASNTQVCLLGDSLTSINHRHRIRCFDARTGALQLDFTRNRVDAYSGVPVKALNDRVLLVEGETATGTDMYYSALTSDGQSIFERRLPDYSYRLALHKNGLRTLSGG